MVPKEVLDFLAKLKQNNNREWFNQRKPYFKDLESRMKLFYGEVTKQLNKHDVIVRTKAFRIYRDIRFSKDKIPFKDHLSSSYARRKPDLRGGYYMEIAPEGRSFIGCGFWKPSNEDIHRVRMEWLNDDREIRKILNDKAFKKYWGTMEGDQLKSAPTGFDKNHPAIALINHKQWIFNHSFTDQEVLDKDFVKKIDEYYTAIRPFFDYMSEVLTTDLNGTSVI